MSVYNFNMSQNELSKLAASVIYTKEENQLMDVDGQVELFVKAGDDGESYGGCPISQQIFMVLLIKAEQSSLNVRVTTVNVNKQRAHFGRLPALVHKDQIITDPDEILDYIDKHWELPDLDIEQTKARHVTLEIFSKFSFFIKQVSHGPEKMIGELRRLNEYLLDNEHKYLCSDNLSHLDCLVLPKLQHIRVASKAFKSFEIPDTMKGVWCYLRAAYDNTIFRQTCPSDQQIIAHWASKPELPPLPDNVKLHYACMPPKFSFDVPL